MSNSENTPIHIQNLGLLRKISRILPLKHRLIFLVKKYLSPGTFLAIRYLEYYDMYIIVSDINRKTVSELILEGEHNQPEISLIKEIKKSLKATGTLIDVGGNIGSFTAQFVNCFKSIIIFEPIPRLNKVIEDSLKYGQVKNVLLIKKSCRQRNICCKNVEQ